MMKPGVLSSPLKLLLIAALLGGCSTENVLRSVYETGRNVCKQKPRSCDVQGETKGFEDLERGKIYLEINSNYM